MSTNLKYHGIEKHRTCQFGEYSKKAYSVDLDTDQEAQAKVPLCAWKPDFDVPPFLHRQVGMAVEFERDCAICTCAIKEPDQ